MTRPERRRAVRIPLSIPGKTFGLGQSKPCVSQNMSESGCNLSCVDPFPTGTHLVVRFDFPIPKACITFDATGQVVRTVAGESMGVQFSSLEDSQRKTLAVLVQQAKRPA